MSRLAGDGRLELRIGWHVRPDSAPPEPIELIHAPEQRAECPREIYLTNPAEEPDTSNHVTRIVWPLASS